MDYVLVSSTGVLVEHFTRQADGAWLVRESVSGGRVDFASIACSVAVDEVYAKVFTEAAT